MLVNSVDICAQTFGRRGNPAILLIAGTGSSMDWWEDGFCTALADGGRFVIRYDMRDTESVHYPAGHPDYGSRELVGDAIGLLDAYGVGSACVMGISAGGAQAGARLLRLPGVGHELPARAWPAVVPAVLEGSGG